MAARKPKSSPTGPGSPPTPRAGRDRPATRRGQTGGEAGAASLRQEAERNWAASDRRAARKRQRTNAKAKE